MTKKNCPKCHGRGWTTFYKEGKYKKENPCIQCNPNGGCFIATVVYEDNNATEIQVLRKFRDKILLSSLCGRLFVKVYYYISPTLAQWIAPHFWIRMSIKKYILDPLVNKIKKNFLLTEEISKKKETTIQ